MVWFDGMHIFVADRYLCSHHRRDGLEVVRRVVVAVVFRGPVAVEDIEAVTLLDNFFADEVVGFMKLRFELGVVLLALDGLDGVRVAVEVILIGLDLGALEVDMILGLDVVGLIPLLLERSCWL